MAAKVLGAVRGNAHVLNYLLIGGATLIPVLLYSNMRSPGQDQIEAALAEDYSSEMAKIKQNTEKINTFWKARRNSVEMDNVYAELLRSGKSSAKRHYELTGSLSETTATQDPQFAQMQRVLALPIKEEERAAISASLGATGTKAKEDSKTSSAKPS